MTKAESAFNKVNTWLSNPINAGKTKSEAFRALKIAPPVYYSYKKPTAVNTSTKTTVTQPTIVALVGSPTAIATAIRGINFN